MSTLDRALNDAQLQRRTMVDEVYEALRDRILSGALSPGERLRVRDVASLLGVSTMPVRDALIRLASAGLVTRTPHQGAVVAHMTLDELRDLYGVRLVLEPEAVRLGLENLKPADDARLLTLLDHVREAVRDGRNEVALHFDEDYLLHVYQASGNAYLLDLITATWTRVKPFKLFLVSTSDPAPDRFLRCAEAIYRAYQAGRPEDGAEAMRLSVQDALDSLAAVIPGSEE